MEFEKKLASLEGVVQSLEQKEISLDEGIELFEKGLLLTKDCLASLSQAKGKIEAIKLQLDELEGAK